SPGCGAQVDLICRTHGLSESSSKTLISGGDSAAEAQPGAARRDAGEKATRQSTRRVVSVMNQWLVLILCGLCASVGLIILLSWGQPLIATPFLLVAVLLAFLLR